MEFINRLKSIATLTFVIIYLLNIFIVSEAINDLLTYLIIFLLVINIPFLKGPNKYISLSLFIIGIVIMLNLDADINEWQKGLNKNAGIVSLLVTVPMLSFPLYYDDFQKAIIKVTQKHLDTPMNFYTVTSLLSYSMGIILNVASMSIIYQLLKETKNRYSNSLFSSALTRGFTGCSIWSPNFVGVAVILHYLNLPWIKIAPLGFVLSIITVYLSIKYEQYIHKHKENNEYLAKNEVSMEISRENKELLIKLTLLGIFLISFIVFCELLTGLSVLVIVPLVSLFIPFFIAIIWGKQHAFYDSFKNYFVYKLPNMKNEIVLFLAAGFFGQALNVAKVGDYVTEVIYFLDIQQSFLLISILIAIIVLLSLIGIHPVITASTIAITLPVSNIPLMPVQFTLTLLTSYAIAALLSPISGTVLITAGILKENPFNIGLIWNWQYALGLVSIYIIILSFVPY